MKTRKLAGKGFFLLGTGGPGSNGEILFRIDR
jgi:hypothetical protein